MATTPSEKRKSIKLNPTINRHGHIQLEMCGGGLTEVPEDVPSLVRLEVLSLTDNHLQSLPVTISRLHKLKVLAVDRNELNYLPDTLLNLIHLLELNLSGNKLSKLPEPLGKLKKLRSLKLAENRFDEMPCDIGELVSLRHLDLSGNNLWFLPESCRHLKNLIYVNLADNIFEQLPISLCQLTSLEMLNLEGNQLLNMPLELSHARQLRDVNISRNKFKSLPKVLLTLHNLQTLDISHNKLLSLPHELGQLPNLRELSARFNMLSSLPNSLPELHLLDVSHNHLSNFSMVHMKQVKHLDCGYNMLENLPLGVYVLPNLEVLKLNSNKISYVSQDIALLDKLKTLDLSNNRLTSLPNIIEEMGNLETFDVRGNKFEKRKSRRTPINGPIMNNVPLTPVAMQSNTSQTHPLFKKRSGDVKLKGKWQKIHFRRPLSGIQTTSSSVRTRQREPLTKSYPLKSGSLSASYSRSRPQSVRDATNDGSSVASAQNQLSPVVMKPVPEDTQPRAEINYPMSQASTTYVKQIETSTPIPPPRKNKNQNSTKKKFQPEMKKQTTGKTRAQKAREIASESVTTHRDSVDTLDSDAATVNETVGDRLSLGEEDFALQPVTVKDDRLRDVCTEVEAMLNSQLIQPIMARRGIFRKIVNENGTLRTLKALPRSLLSDQSTTPSHASTDHRVTHVTGDVFLKPATDHPLTSHYSHRGPIEWFTVTSAGGKYKSRIDPEICAHFPVNAVRKPTVIGIQIEDVFLASIRQHHSHPLLDNLLHVAPIVHLQHSPPDTFHHPVSLTIPAPPANHNGSLHLLTYQESGACLSCNSAFRIERGYLTLNARHFTGKGAVVTKSRCKYKACQSAEMMRRALTQTNVKYTD